MFEWIEALDTKASWMVPLIFSFVGGIISIIFQPIVASINRNLDLSVRAWERIQDERIDAYKVLLSLANSMSITVATGKHEDGLIETIPFYLQSKKELEDFSHEVSVALSNVDDWVDHKTRQHLRYLTDYFQNLTIAARLSSEDDFSELGHVAKPDLIDLAVLTRLKAHSFFKSINKKSFKYVGNGKYRLSKTERLLKNTMLLKWMVEKGLLLRQGELVPPEITP